MSHSKSNLIDIESPEAASNLHFQEFPIKESAAKLDITSHTLTFNNPPEIPSSGSGYSNDQRIPSAPYQEDTGDKPAASFWSVEYYQQLFDVDTVQVMERIKGSMCPKPGINFLQHHIQSKPDLYGPFWVCITLVFTIAISGNLANYLQTAGSRSYHWKYDFHAVTFAATAIFCYAWLWPLILWGLMKWQGSEQIQIPLLELLCVFGYSLSIYIPVSVLWLIQIGWMQWLLVLIGAALSGLVLVTAIWPAFSNRSAVMLSVVAGCHLLLAVSFMLYFFHVPPITDSVHVVLTSTLKTISGNSTSAHK